MRVSFRSMLAVGVTSMLAGQIAISDAFAQQQPAVPGVSQDGDDEEAIVVTGSRLRRSEFTSSAPIEVITAEEMELEGVVDTGEALQNSNIAATGPQQNLASAGFAITGTAFGGSGATNVSLRGLGAQRTLTLLNGRRLGPSGVTGFIAPFNPNVLPQSIVGRIDILKDGASSVYGSDAVAGVVNLITRDDLEGGRLNLYASLPTEGGGDVVRASGAYGWVTPRWHLNVSGEYYEQRALEARHHYDLYCAADYITDSVTGAVADVIDPHTGQPKCFDNFNWGGATIAGTFHQLDPSNAEGAYGAYANNPWFAQGWRRVGLNGNRDSFSLMRSWHPFYGIRNAIVPVERGTVFVTGAYDITNDFTVYGEVLSNHTQTNFTIPAPFGPTINAAHPGNPFGANAQANLVLERNFLNEIDYTRAVVGARGEISNGWAWDAYVQRSVSDATYESPNIFADALRHVDGNAANGECGVAGVTVAPISGGACPGVIPWFSPRVLLSVPAGFNQAESDFLFFNSVGVTEYTETTAEVSFTGPLFDLPAGSVDGAFGVFYLEDELNDVPDPRTVSNAQLAGAAPTRGSYSMWEAFGEVGVPLLADAPLAYRLDLSLSGRYTEHDSYGSNSTYKVGLDWRLTPEFRIRSTYGTSYRAPALYERFLSSSFLGFIAPQVDACINWDSNPDLTLRTNCQAAGLPAGWNPSPTPFTTVSNSGNPNLEPEESTAFTVGSVWSPGGNFNIAVDYFEFEVENQISRYFVFPQVRDCYESPSYPAAPECATFVRDTDPASPTFRRIISAVDNYVNIASQVNRGLDITLGYSHDVPFGELSLNSQFTWIFEDVVTSFSGATPNPRNGELGYPEVVGNTSVRYDFGRWTVNWNAQYIGPTAAPGTNIGNSSRYPGTPVVFTNDTEEVIYHDFSLRRRHDGFSWQIGVQNAFDERPPALSTGNLFRRGLSALPNYDVIGRRAYVSLSAEF